MPQGRIMGLNKLLGRRLCRWPAFAWMTAQATSPLSWQDNRVPILCRRSGRKPVPAPRSDPTPPISSKLESPWALHCEVSVDTGQIVRFKLEATPLM